MEKETIEGLAEEVVLDILLASDLAVEQVATYLRLDEKTDTDPSRLAARFLAIGAYYCDLNEGEIVAFLTQLNADGVFGATAEKAPTKFAVVTSVACRTGEEVRAVWEKAIAALGGELTTTVDLADAVVVLEADVAAVQSVRELNADARIATVLPKVDSVLQQAVRDAGANHVYFPLETSDSAKFVLEDVLRRM